MHLIKSVINIYISTLWCISSIKSVIAFKQSVQRVVTSTGICMYTQVFTLCHTNTTAVFIFCGVLAHVLTIVFYGSLFSFLHASLHKGKSREKASSMETAELTGEPMGLEPMDAV